MATQAQILANRRNAAKSTGPKTPEGRSTVAKNAVKHGLLSTGGLLLGEDAEAYEQLSHSVYLELAPDSAIQMTPRGPDCLDDLAPATHPRH